MAPYGAGCPQHKPCPKATGLWGVEESALLLHKPALCRSARQNAPSASNSKCSLSTGMAPPWGRDTGLHGCPRGCVLAGTAELEDWYSQGFWGGKSKGGRWSLEIFLARSLQRKAFLAQSNWIHHNHRPPLCSFLLPLSILTTGHQKQVQIAHGRKARRSRKHSQ